MKKVLFFLLQGALCFASYEAPWFGNAYELEGEIEAALAYYKTIHTSNGPLTYHDSQKLVRGSLEASLTDWQFVLEASSARTSKESFNLTCGSFLVRYNLMNDVDGSSAFSLTAGLRGDFPKSAAIRDPGLLYSSYCQGEAQLSVGKEWISGPYWTWHLWLLGALGSGTRYSPWIKGKLGFERNFEDIHQMGCYLLGQEGFGQSRFPGIEAFQSYGPLAYRLADLSLRYAYKFCYICSVSVEYTLRLAASECPANRQAIAVTINIPFSVI